MDFIYEELKKTGVAYTNISEIHSKGGVFVYRVTDSSGKTYVIKYFQRESYRREIENYNILRSLGITTIHVIAATDRAILMEDISQSDVYRLGTAEDLNDVSVASAIAKWYRELHDKGKAYVERYGADMYDESDVITVDNLEMIMSRTKTFGNPLWTVLIINLNTIKNKISSAERTLTYNDFYYTNLIAAKDKSKAFMFDYNLLGKGYAYADIRNVLSALTPEASSAFLREYSEYDEREKIIDDVASALVTLYFGCCEDVIPKWASEYVKQIKNGRLYDAAARLLKTC